MLTVVTDDDARAELTAELDEIVREGARRMLAAALEAEIDGPRPTRARRRRSPEPSLEPREVCATSATSGNVRRPYTQRLGLLDASVYAVSAGVIGSIERGVAGRYCGAMTQRNGVRAVAPEAPYRARPDVPLAAPELLLGGWRPETLEELIRARLQRQRPGDGEQMTGDRVYRRELIGEVAEACRTRPATSDDFPAPDRPGSTMPSPEGARTAPACTMK